MHGREIVNEGPEKSRAEKRSVSLILKDHLQVPLRVAGKGVPDFFRIQRSYYSTPLYLSISLSFRKLHTSVTQLPK